ncbi:tryptophan--tRNA ligase [Cucumis melo var. makuwa]|uniref:tryptophan--tRNA ligase n=1 Tax=Cucumis melo var. makuwa TaxID=1194695 RepID=A0A5D3BJF3_CUCMM|nr:tryptophan--tRNA ligase [Cucumis melo var. makuwa]
MLLKLKEAIKLFKWCLGQKLNWEKSALSGVNIPEDILLQTAVRICCKAENLPVISLGLPLGGYPPLSLEKITRNFFWEGNSGSKLNYLVKWNLVSFPLKGGVLGLGGLKIHNSALLAKWGGDIQWMIFPFWRKIICSITAKSPLIGLHWEKLASGQTFGLAPPLSKIFLHYFTELPYFPTVSAADHWDFVTLSCLYCYVRPPIVHKDERKGKKINKYAFSGGQDSIEKHRLYGANLEVDIPIKYLNFFLDDDAELERITKEYGAGRMLTGEVKQRLIQVLTEMVERHRRARAAVTDELAASPIPTQSSCSQPSVSHGLTHAWPHLHVQTSDRPSHIPLIVSTITSRLSVSS